jgi:hypothetical protein
MIIFWVYGTDGFSSVSKLLSTISDIRPHLDAQVCKNLAIVSSSRNGVRNLPAISKEDTTLDYGAHLPVIDFGFRKFSLKWLSAYVRTARDLGFKAVLANDHLLYSRPVARRAYRSCRDPL